MLSMCLVVMIVGLVLMLILEWSFFIMLINIGVVVISICVVVDRCVMSVFNVLIVVVGVHWMVSFKVHWQVMTDINMMFYWLEPFLMDNGMGWNMVVGILSSGVMEIAL